MASSDTQHEAAIEAAAKAMAATGSDEAFASLLPERQREYREDAEAVVAAYKAARGGEERSAVEALRRIGAEAAGASSDSDQGRTLSAIAQDAENTLAALGGERKDALDAGAHHGDDIADLWRGELLGRAARSGEAEGERLRSAANELLEAYDDWAVNSYPADNGSRTAAEAWHAESHRVNRAVEILRLAFSQHSEPRAELGRPDDELEAALDADNPDPPIRSAPEPRQAEGDDDTEPSETREAQYNTIVHLQGELAAARSERGEWQAKAEHRARRFNELVEEHRGTEAEVERLRDKAELVVQELLELLPLEGDWMGGYEVHAPVDARVSALPEQWASAALQVSELHRLLIAGAPLAPSPDDRGGEPTEREIDADAARRVAQAASQGGDTCECFDDGWMAAQRYFSQQRPERKAIEQILDLRDTEWATDPSDMDQRIVAGIYGGKLEAIFRIAERAADQSRETSE